MPGRGKLHLAMPPAAIDMSEPHTPIYEFNVTLPRMPDPPSTAPSASTSLSSGISGISDSPRTPDMSALAILTPPSTGPDDIWEDEEVEVLENVLNRPPETLHFAPGAMPPPYVLDELATLVLARFEPTDGYDASAEPSECDASDFECDSERSSRAGSPLPTTNTKDGLLAVSGFGMAPMTRRSAWRHSDWPHSWNQTRNKLASLALQDTRFAADRAEREERKAFRVERLARPAPKRCDSMDFLDEMDDGRAGEQLGRALRLSTALQNSMRDSRSASPISRTTSPIPRTTSRPFALTITPAEALLNSAPPMRRQNSSRSDRSTCSSRRPSLLARGRSFTAEDLEMEERAGAGSCAVASSCSSRGKSMSPRVMEQSPGPEDVPMGARSPLGWGSSGTASGSAGSGSGSSSVSMGADRSERLVPPQAGLPSLGSSFELSTPASHAPRRAAGWDSDSDSGIVIKRPRRRGIGLAMTAMTSSRPGLMLDMSGLGPGGALSLRSPFEEKNVIDLT